MKSTGMIRRLDELGRVVIPKEIRKQLDIDEKDSLEIFVDKKNIILKKVEDTCVFCEKSKDLISYKGKLICKECLENILAINEQNKWRIKINKIK